MNTLMDWEFSIERHRAPLLVIIAGLYTMMGLTEGGSMARVKRSTYRKVLLWLRPAEAALRRLIIAAAHVLDLKPGATRADGAATSERSTSSKSKGTDQAKGQGKDRGKSQGRRLFRLFDLPRRISPLLGRRRRRRGPEPRIRSLGPDPDAGYDISLSLHNVSFRNAPIGLSPLYARATPPPPAPPDDSVSAASLCRRLAAILDALKDIPRHARRYARWRDKPIEQRRPKRDCALRTGPPPYLKRKSKHEIHYILSECHWLAHEALKLELKPDTS